MIGFSYFLNKKEPEPKPKDNGIVANIRKPVDTSNWNEYKSELGFSIKLPKEVYATGWHCHEDVLNPLRVLEDKGRGRVYIFEDYYQLDKEGNCVKIVRSLEDIRKQTDEEVGQGYYPGFDFGWTIIINEPTDNEDTLKYIKDNFGSTCSIDSENQQTDGTYDIRIKGRKLMENGQWIMDETCNTDFAYKITYSQEKNRLMSVVLGQEGKFYSSNPETSSDSQGYDEEMIKTFKFE